MGRPRNYIQNGSVSVPITLVDGEAKFSSLNSRFTVRKAKVLSLNQIANGFHFRKDVALNSMYQLDMIPVVGYYNGEDFEGHEEEEVPYGAVIPKTGRFEEIDGEEWVVADVALWSKRYEEVSDLSENNQSIEIVGITGKYNKEDKFYEVESYTYDALTILGKDVKPAFKGAGFESEEFTDEFNKFKEEFQEFLKDINNNEKEDGKVGEDLNNENFENNQNQEVEMVTFALSHEAIRDKLFRVMNPTDEEGYRQFNYWIAETKNDTFVAEDANNYGTFYRFNYAEVDGLISVDMESKVEVFPSFMTSEEMSQLDELKSKGEKFEEVNADFESLSVKYASLTDSVAEKDAKIAELETYKANKEQEEFAKLAAENKEKVEQIVSTFSSKLSSEEIKDVLGEDYSQMKSEEVNSLLSVAFAKKFLNDDNANTQRQVFANISDNSPKVVTNEDRLIEEAKALRNKKNIK